MVDVNEKAGEWPRENDGNVERIDARPLLETGREPLPVILEACVRLEEGKRLLVRAPFEPVPLYGLMAGRGFLSRSRKLSDDGQGECWEVLFYRETAAEKGVAAQENEATETEEEGLFLVDLREDGVSEGVGRMSSALEGLRYDDVLLVRHNQNPALLLSHLDREIFTHRQDAEDPSLLRIWRKR